jgi:hypothetical protein
MTQAPTGIVLLTTAARGFVPRCNPCTIRKTKRRRHLLPRERRGVRFLTAAFAISVVPAIALAQQAASKATQHFENIACFEVVSGNQNTVPQRPILLNRCTGATWLLEKRFARDLSGKLTRSFHWYWSPLPIGTADGADVDPLATGSIMVAKKARAPTLSLFHF